MNNTTDICQVTPVVLSLKFLCAPPQVSDSTSRFLQCAGVPLGTLPDPRHMQNLVGLVDAALDVYSFMVREFASLSSRSGSRFLEREREREREGD